MSVGEEQTECPLCMEPLEMDDMNFFPCTCGYQICRFCWHRIRTNENGLCPACRKQYPEDPAEFKPLTEDELQRIKKERRQKDLQRKQKAAENRKHLANVRVVQKNLVFVVGLSQRLADPEVLKKHEYFGKFGKIHKVVINQSTSYAGAQGPSASAYVTYHKPEDALKAIQAVNNVYVDGRTLKASLGTTKYCSHFLRGAQCPKPDCMYLHELGEEAASFTKEEMQQGKHQEYEQKLYEQYMNSQNLANHHVPSSTTKTQSTRKKTNSPTTIQQPTQPPTPQQSKQTQPQSSQKHPPPNAHSKEAWPSLQGGGPGSNSSNGVAVGNGKLERLTNGNKVSHVPPSSAHKQDTQNAQNRAPGNHRNRNTSGDTETKNSQSKDVLHLEMASTSTTVNSVGLSGSPGSNPVPQLSPTQVTPPQTQTPSPLQTQLQQHQTALGNARKSLFDNSSDSMSLFSSANGFPTTRNPKPPIPAQPCFFKEDSIPTTEISETIPVSSTTDWQAAFGFKPAANTQEWHDDDLGFDPWDESSKALADLIEKEGGVNPYKANHTSHQLQQQIDNRPKNAPPGFTSNHIGAYTGNPGRTPNLGVSGNSKMLGLMQFSNVPGNMAGHATQNSYPDVLSDVPVNASKDGSQNNTQDIFNMKDWQDGLRALLPNINISFGGANHYTNNAGLVGVRQQQQPQQVPQKSSNLSESPPHWMASLQHLTEAEPMAAPANHNHRLPFVQQFPFRAPAWPPQTQHPPPGFQAPQLRPHTQVAEGQKLAEGLQ